jgi:hypothetical protein
MSDHVGKNMHASYWPSEEMDVMAMFQGKEDEDAQDYTDEAGTAPMRGTSRPVRKHVKKLSRSDDKDEVFKNSALPVARRQVSAWRLATLTPAR